MTSTPTDAVLVAAETMATEEHLRRFYVELQAWIDGGLQTPSKFSPAYGLCGNLDGWCAHEEDDDICPEELLDEMSRSFEAAELSDIYPFNGFGDAEYKRERTAGGLYRNPARLAWIKAHATPDGAERVHTGPLAAASAEHSPSSPSPINASTDGGEG